MKSKRWIAAIVLGLLLVGVVAQATMAAPRQAGWGPGSTVGGGFGMRGGMSGMMGGNLYTITADALGINVNDVYTLKSEGKSFYEIAKSKGVSEKDLLDKAIAVHKQYVDQSVTNGYLTQANADLMLQAMTERIDAQLKGTTGGAGFGPGGFRGNFRGNQQSGFGRMMGPGFWGSGTSK